MQTGIFEGRVLVPYAYGCYGYTRGGAVTGRRVTYIYNTLPSVDASDDGKTLRVVDGA